jgi:methylmalonyl-CoA/ethylmalonyl-CoA epimerase
MNMRLHHIGIAVRELAPALGEFTSAMGYAVVSLPIHDLVQTAFVQFLRRPQEQSCVELVAADGPDSKLIGALKRGGGLNHLCYATDDIDQACRRLRDEGMLVIHEPVAAVAFPGRRIAWLMGGQRVLTELVEEGTDRWQL